VSERCGVIAMIKPPGTSSGGMSGLVRRTLRVERAGHAGTLDPGAAGVLPVCFGRATRIADYLMAHEKEYIAEVCFGAATDTQDSFGRILRKVDCDVKEAEVKHALAEFQGELTQVTPAYSAVRIDGKRAYELARRGETLAMPERRIVVSETEYLRKNEKNRYLFRIRCGKGTYIRAIAEDLGAALGLPAYMSFLLRTEAGGFQISKALSGEELMFRHEAGDDSFIVSAEEALHDLPEVRLPEQRRFALENGLPTNYDNAPKTAFRLYCGDSFFGIGAAGEDGIRLKIPLMEK